MKFVKPETVRLPLSDGGWILVKKRLTAGESRRVYARQVKSAPAGERPELNLETVGLAEIMEYLVDWSAVDSEGQPVLIRGVDPDVVAAAVNSLETDDYNEIYRAIQTHIAAMQAEREAEKKTRSDALKS